MALGAISEADRHNIRGERISVDTIPLVGEAELAAAVRAVAWLPRVKVLVMAGALMGGDITRAVTGVKERGIIVISLNMAGSVPEEADLVGAILFRLASWFATACWWRELRFISSVFTEILMPAIRCD